MDLFFIKETDGDVNETSLRHNIMRSFLCLFSFSSVLTVCFLSAKKKQNYIFFGNCSTTKQIQIRCFSITNCVFFAVLCLSTIERVLTIINGVCLCFIRPPASLNVMQNGTIPWWYGVGLGAVGWAGLPNARLNDYFYYCYLVEMSIKISY